MGVTRVILPILLVFGYITAAVAAPRNFKAAVAAPMNFTTAAVAAPTNNTAAVSAPMETTDEGVPDEISQTDGYVHDGDALTSCKKYEDKRIPIWDIEKQMSQMCPTHDGYPTHGQLVIKVKETGRYMCVNCTVCPEGEECCPKCTGEFFYVVAEEDIDTFQRCTNCSTGRFKHWVGPGECEQCRTPCGNMVTLQTCTRFQERKCGQCKPGFYNTDVEGCLPCCYCGSDTDGFSPLRKEECDGFVDQGELKECQLHDDHAGTCVAPTLPPPPAPPPQGEFNYLALCLVLLVLAVVVVAGCAVCINKWWKNKTGYHPPACDHDDDNGDGDDERDDDGDAEEAELLLYDIEGVMVSVSEDTKLCDMINHHVLAFHNFCQLAEEPGKDGSNVVAIIANHFGIEAVRYGRAKCQELGNQLRSNALFNHVFLKEEIEIKYVDFLRALRDMGLTGLLNLLCHDLHQEFLQPAADLNANLHVCLPPDAVDEDTDEEDSGDEEDLDAVAGEPGAGDCVVDIGGHAVSNTGGNQAGCQISASCDAVTYQANHVGQCPYTPGDIPDSEIDNNRFASNEPESNDATPACNAHSSADDTAAYPMNGSDDADDDADDDEVTAIAERTVFQRSLSHPSRRSRTRSDSESA